MKHLIAYCGVDCSSCKDFKNKICLSCRKTEWKEDDMCMPVQCCKSKGIEICAQCSDFPCQQMKAFYEESESHKDAYCRMLKLKKKVLTPLIILMCVLLTSCASAFPSTEKIVQMKETEAAELLKGRTKQEIHEHWGEPHSFYSGLYGDIYVYNETCIGVFYEYGSDTVVNIAIFDRQH